MAGSRFTLEVQPRIPTPLARLDELANNLVYSWDRRVRGLFARLDRALWAACGSNPRVFLRRVSQAILDEAAEDRGYLEEYRRVLSSFDAYMERGLRPACEQFLDPDEDLVAYFCAEFGLHESFPIYSGGLGILAGDHCKAASDLGIPFVGVGLLYHNGYFIQTIDGHGNQISQIVPSDFRDLPIQPVDVDGERLRIDLDFPGRSVAVHVWEARVGHIRLYLLDTDVAENSEADRRITRQLYGGGREMRLEQEIVLGIGGTRALRRLGLKPTAWHINEGHAAFLVLERCREYVQQGHTLASALEIVASGTVFTTHTPVPAGHDIFDTPLFETYFRGFAESLGVSMRELLALGSVPEPNGSFNMTTLALKGSRFHNGVSRIHGEVASVMERAVWPQIPPEENPMTHITNGVHMRTFLASEWYNLFDMRFDEWHDELLNADYWERIEQIPDYQFWSVRKQLKEWLLQELHRRVVQQYRRNGESEATIARVTHLIAKPGADTLVMGFARRFATYKRATLLFSDPARLARLLNDPERPTVHRVRRQGAPQRRAGTAPDQGDPRVLAAPRVPGAHHRARGLRHPPRAATGLRRGSVAEHAGIPARGQRDLGAEGRDQRGGQPERARRLVGRGLQRQERLGHRAARAAARHRAAQPRRGQGPARPDRARGAAALLRAQRPRLLLGLGRAGQGVDEIHHPALQLAAHGDGLRDAAVLPGARTAPAPECRQRRRCARARGMEGARARALAGRAHRAGERSARRGAPRRGGASCACASR